jgi:hypothetical protein
VLKKSEAQLATRTNYGKPLAFLKNLNSQIWEVVAISIEKMPLIIRQANKQTSDV